MRYFNFIGTVTQFGWGCLGNCWISSRYPLCYNWRVSSCFHQVSSSNVQYDSQLFRGVWQRRLRSRHMRIQSRQSALRSVGARITCGRSPHWVCLGHGYAQTHRRKRLPPYHMSEFNTVDIHGKQQTDAAMQVAVIIQKGTQNTRILHNVQGDIITTISGDFVESIESVPQVIVRLCSVFW